jgi:cyclophilin family peptidyl-prolyl cis-trans isomerase/HEAT repeat protein
VLRSRHERLNIVSSGSLVLALAALGSASCAPTTATTDASATSPTARTPKNARNAQPSNAAPRHFVLTTTEITSLARLLRMEDARVLDTALVRTLLADGNAYIRGKAALAAGRAGDIRASLYLRRSTADSDDDVVADAAFAIGELGDTSAASIATLQQIMVRPSGGAAAREAAHALGKIVRPASYAALSGGLQRAARDVIPEILLAIWHHPRQPATVGLVAPFAADADAHTRFAAVYALSRAPRPAGMETLLNAMRDTDPLVRETAAKGLRAAMVDSVKLRDAARAALLSALSDTSSHVRINAVRTIAQYREPGLFEPISILLRDPDGNVRTSAASALGDLRDPRGEPVLLALAADETQPISIRAAALQAAGPLSRPASPPFIDAARAWTHATSWLQRMYGVRALALAPYALVRDDLLAAVRDPDPRVDAEALGAVAAADTADTTHSLDALYLESLASADVMVRAGAISALARHRDANYAPALLDAYARALNDRENDAALAAVNALATLARTDSAITRSFLFRFRPSSDPVLRAAVVRRFGTAASAWADGPPGVRNTVNFYEQVVRDWVAPVVAGAPRPHFVIHSDRGDITAELYSDEAPMTANSFAKLAASGYFTKSDFRWHRVVPNFVLQDGDPRGDGNGGPGYSIRDEINRLRYTRGALGMALSGPDTGGSQFFITHSPQPHLDGGYTVFGYVIGGMDVADRVVQDEAIHGIDIIR